MTSFVDSTKWLKIKTNKNATTNKTEYLLLFDRLRENRKNCKITNNMATEMALLMSDFTKCRIIFTKRIALSITSAKLKILIRRASILLPSTGCSSRPKTLSYIYLNFFMNSET